MVAFDMDGTLVDSKKQISEFTWEVLRKAIDQGVVVLPATGRPLSGVPQELKDFPGIEYAVTANGARVVNVKTGETVFESSVSMEKALEILDVFRGLISPHWQSLNEQAALGCRKEVKGGGFSSVPL